jgi:hypothetical protein
LWRTITRGLVCYDKKAFDRAIADRDEAIRLYPEFPLGSEAAVGWNPERPEGHRDDRVPLAVGASSGCGVAPPMRTRRPIPRLHSRAVATMLTVSRAHQGLSPTKAAYAPRYREIPTRAVTVPPEAMGSRAIVLPSGSTTPLSPVLVARTRNRRLSIARNAAIRWCWCSAAERPNQESEVRLTSSSAPSRVAARASAGTVSS